MTEIKKDKGDFSRRLVRYENMWVALSKKDGKFILADKNLCKLVERLKTKDQSDIEFVKVPQSDVCYAPSIYEV